jgi:hypothetical protein
MYVQQNNQYPLGKGVAIVSALLYALTLDASGKRLPWWLLVSGIQAITGSILLFWNTVGPGTKFAAYCESSPSLLLENLS